MKETGLTRPRAGGAAALLAAAWLLAFWTASAGAQGAPEDELGPMEDEPAPAEPAPAPEAPAPEPAPAEPASEPAPAEASVDVGVTAELTTEAPPAEEAPAEPADAGEIVVTGSRIKRTSFAVPSAVQVVDRKQLEMSGATNMADVVKNMDINYGSEFNTDVSTGSGGTAQFNLRGLGLSSTLVLLNGRRVVQSGATSTDGSNFVDINSIPLAAVERIEILKGGASAIYGSDAVAGVVNVITRKRLDGFEAQIGGQATDDFDHGEWDVSLLGGSQGETTRVLGMVSYFKREPLDAEDRDFTKNGRNVSNLGFPSTFLQLTPMFTPMTTMTDPSIGEPPDMVKGLSFQDPGCADAPLSAPTQDVFPVARLDFCTFNFNPYFQLMMQEQRVNAHGSVEQDIGDHVMAFFESSYARARSERTLSPAFPILQPIIVPADHAYNPTGNNLRIYGRILGGEAPPGVQFYESDTFGAAAGLQGDFGGLTDSKVGEWEWQLAGTWGVNQYYFGLGDALTAVLQGALNSCSPGADPAGCWNPFYDGAPNSQTLTDAIVGELRVKTDVELTTVGADLSGPIVELPGGDLSLALGAQMRNESAVVDVDHDGNQENYVFLIGGPDWSSERRILAGYGELGLPFFDGFELQAAGRLEDYEDVGSSINPMAGLSWVPATTFQGDEASRASKVRIRGTVATSFRAPSLLQVDGAQTELAETYDVNPDANGDPVQASSPVYRAVRTYGNPDIDPQKAMAITAGLEWSPVEGFMLGGDYWRYDYDDYIVKESAQQKIASDYLCNVNVDPAACDSDVHRDDQNIVQQIDVAFVNAHTVLTHGVDFNVGYRSDFGGSAGTFAVGLSGTYVLSYEIPSDAVGPDLRDEDFMSCSGDTCDVAGVRNFANFARPIPQLRITLPLGWDLDGHSAGLTGHFISGYTDDADSNPLPGAANEDYLDIDGLVTLDLQYQYRLDEGDGAATTFRVGVQNLLDSDPPEVNAGYGYDVFTHDPRGRMIYGRLIQEL